MVGLDLFFTYISAVSDFRDSVSSDPGTLIVKIGNMIREGLPSKSCLAS